MGVGVQVGVGVCGLQVKNIEVLSFFFFFPNLSGLHSQHIEVPKLGVELELQLLAYTTATATWDLSHVCDLLHSSWQH